MTNKKKKIFLISLIFLFFFFIIGKSQIANAADNPNSKVSVSPPIIEETIQAGKSIDKSFIYTNGTDHDQKLKIEVAPFVPSNGTSGAPKFNDDNGNPITSPSQEWISILPLSQDVVPAGGEQEVKFTINIPSDAVEKKYYDAIFVTGKDTSVANTEGSSNVVNYKIGVLMVMDVKNSGIASTIKKVPLQVFNNISDKRILILIGIILFLLLIAIIVFIKKRFQ